MEIATSYITISFSRGKCCVFFSHSCWGFFLEGRGGGGVGRRREGEKSTFSINNTSRSTDVYDFYPNANKIEFI